MQLTSYQRDWILDQSKDKIVCKSRRIGFTEANALECALDAVGIDVVNETTKPPSDQLIGSTGEEQARAKLERVLRHIKILGEVTMSGDILQEKPGVTVLRLNNGVVCRALSSNPATWRGWQGDVSLDEFAHVPRAEELWVAASKCADRTLARPGGYKRKVLSTPNGDDNKFYKLFCTDEGDSFSRHKVTIHDAIEAGFPASWEEICAQNPDPDERAQEYECSFLAASLRYIAAQAYDECIYDEVHDPGLHFYLCAAGFDVARRRHNAALVQLGRIGDVLWVTRAETQRDMRWDDMEQWVGEAVRQTQGRCAIDATGIGSQFAERMQAAHPMQIEPVTFTLQSKEMLASGLKLAIDRKRVRVPHDPQLRRDVLALRRIITDAGNVRYDARETPDGHADLAWALALGIYAAGGTIADGIGTPISTGAPRKTAESLATKRSRKGALRHM